VTTTRTAIELGQDGAPLRVFHRRGSSAWTHPIGEPRSDARCGCKGEPADPDPGSARSRKRERERARQRRKRAGGFKNGVVASPGPSASAATVSRGAAS
jgi:hypothetical protein